MSRVILWLRQDLRLADNPALRACCDKATELLIVFIDDPTDQTVSSLGAASRVWLHHSLLSLEQSLQRKGQKLVCFQGSSQEILLALVKATDADMVCWNRVYDPVSKQRDSEIKTVLSAHTIVRSFNAVLLIEPWHGCKDDGTPYRVYTPFYRKMSVLLPGQKPLPAPAKLPLPPAPEKLKLPRSKVQLADIHAFGLLPKEDWHQSMMQFWQVGEAAARNKLKAFLKQDVEDYGLQRDLPGTLGTSRLSPHLHFGEISPRQIIHAIFDTCHSVATPKSGSETFLKEVVWREFAYHLLHHFPDTVSQPLDRRFKRFPWPRLSGKALRCWQQGMTGVPIVDAGMRELWHSGWMHNRVRMIVASYLVKNLQIPWQWGEAWFRDTLVDADIASNVMGWQWTAGCGADAAPYFRVFNPVLQGEKFDADGSYVKRWLPELANVEKKFLHKPWELSTIERAALDYPEPLVDLKASRQRALDAFASIKQS